MLGSWPDEREIGVDETQVRAVLEVVKAGTLATQATGEFHEVDGGCDRIARYTTAARIADVPFQSEGGG